jgi:hypothetical protein
LPRFCLLLLIASLVWQPLQAAPTPSIAQRSQLNALCSGTGVAWPASTQQRGILLSDNTGQVHALHDELPATLRADSVASTGLVLCITAVETILETCNINLFFSNLPRIRQDYQVQLRAVRTPAAMLNSTTLAGEAPPTCSNPGTLSSGQSSLRGKAPAMAALTTWLTAIGVGATDSDNDGLSNLSELITGSSSSDAQSPGPYVSITANGSTNLLLDEGESFTLQLNFLPGNKQGQLTDYSVWAESRGAVFAYVYPQGFKPATTKQVSVRTAAVRLNNFTLLTLPGLGIGDYRLYFEAKTSDGTTLSSSATLTVQASQWKFAEISAAAGLTHQHGYNPIADGIQRDRQFMAAGVAAGDYDKDGWTDLYVTRGSRGANLLYRNLGNGSFSDVAATAGVALTGLESSGATFADYDGDGWLDLLVSGINATDQLRLFHNNGNGTFTDMASAAGLPLVSQGMSSSFADYDKDGDLDFWLTHWSADTQHKYLFRNNLANNGSSTFTDVSVAAGIPDDVMNDYTANFADINNDGWLDVLVAADFRTSQIFTNQRNGTFTRSNAGLSDENGMGAAVGDYDNDGDLDWFVSNIYDDRPSTLNLSKELLGITWGLSGNRFYRNRGDGSFDDITELTGTRRGGWGWGACFADFNNDGWLDLFHVNGYESSLDNRSPFPFRADASRLYINDKRGGFTERSVELGINDNKQGRGIVCFDYDRDGDVDIFVANNEQTPLLYENRGLQRHWLEVKVGGEARNSEAIGARIYLTVNGVTQMREINAGSNFMSQNPTLAHFGVGSASVIDEVRVVWPSGTARSVTAVAADQILELVSELRP